MRSSAPEGLAGSNLGSVGQRSPWGVIKGDLLFTAVFMRSGPAGFFSVFSVESGQKRDKNNLSRRSNHPKMVKKALIRSWIRHVGCERDGAADRSVSPGGAAAAQPEALMVLTARV